MEIWNDYDEDYGGDNLIENFEVLHETDKAWLILEGNQKAWFPKSQCSIEEDGFIYPDWLTVSWETHDE